MPTLEDKVAFLSRPDAYPEYTRHVETKETHMSWVFLTDTQAWKLKKPSRFNHLDLSSIDARRHNCEEEVRLNRRLAPDVYLGITPLTIGPGSLMQLGKPGIIDDWLVRMRRLPSDRMLDQAIAAGSWSHEDLQRVGGLLTRFYSQAAPAVDSADEYLNLLQGELRSSRDALTNPPHPMDARLIDATISGALAFVDQHAKLLQERVDAGRVIEAHGDLRPEHICLESEPAIIDCLEFDRRLRILDPVSELMFLELECDRLGAPGIGRHILNQYCTATGDHVSERLMKFYRTYHAAVRAKVAIWHVRDHSIRDIARWTGRAEEYLRLAG